MFNQSAAPGWDAQPIGAPATNITPTHSLVPSVSNTDVNKNSATPDVPVELKNGGMAMDTEENNPSPYDLDFPPLPTSEDRLEFLTRNDRHAPIPNPWKDALTQREFGRVDRLYVMADGSCAGGALMLARADATLGNVSMSQARSPEAIREFRTNHMTACVRAWSAEQWCAMVPHSLRQDLLDHKPRCGCGSVTLNSCTCPSFGPIDERDLFISLCERATYAIGPVFFHIAAAVMKIGVLLLVNDSRYRHHPTRQVQDFGTGDYPSSMIILALYLPPKHKDAHGIGHYETVGLLQQSGPPHQTLFTRGDPMLAYLRDFAAQRNTEKTLDHQRINFLHYPALACPDNPGLALQQQSPSMSLTAATIAPGISTAARSNSRLVRERRPSARLLNAIVDQPSVQPKQSAGADQRGTPSKRSQMEQHVMSTSPDPLLAASVMATPARSMSIPHTMRAELATEAMPSSTARPMGAVPALPPPASTRRDTMAASVLANVRNWVRRTVNHGRLAPEVHFSAIPMWTLRCRTVLQALAASLRPEHIDVREVVAHLCVLWMLPGEIFTVPSRSGGGSARRKNRHNRIHGKLNDDGLIMRMMQEVMRLKELTSADAEADAWGSVTSVLQLHNRPPVPDDTPTESIDADLAEVIPPLVKDKRAIDVKAVQRAQRMFERGHSFRAMQALTSTSEMADLDKPEERVTLRSLHPPAQHCMPEMPSDASEVVVDWDWMEAEMRASNTGAAAGPSGYGSNYLSVLAADPHCVQALAFFIQHIVNNKLPEVVHTLLTTCMVVSLVKDNDGRRPVAIGDIFYRMASRYALALVTKRAQERIAAHQYGAGKPDGCTQIVHSIQHLLTATAPPSPGPPSQGDLPSRPMACLSIDVKNAFNSIDRAAVLRAVYSCAELAQCWRTVAFGYGRPSLLLMQCDDSVPDSEAFIESQTGVRQGDPLAALLFSLTMHPVYDQLAKVASAGCYAFIDDGHFVGTIEECWRVWTMLPSQLNPLGLSVNATKCELTCFRIHQIQDDLDRAALDRFRASSLNINDRTLKLLGCVIGADDASISAALNDSSAFRTDQLAAFRRIGKMKKQTGMLALQHLTGTVITNRVRAMTPGATLQHAKRYDSAVMRAAHAIIGITKEDGSTYDEQLQAPLSLGGFGLTSAVCIAPAAYIAGAENTLRHSPAFADIWSGTRPLSPTCGLFAAIEDSIHRITTIESSLIARSSTMSGSDVPRISDPILPASASSFVSHYQTKPVSLLQSCITHRIATLSFIARVSETARAGPTGKYATASRLLSLRAAESALWLQTLPTESALTFTDAKWQWAAWLRLGIPVPTIDTDCPGCKTEDAYSDNSWHSVACVPLSGRAMTDRHNLILDTFCRFCRLMQVNVRSEPARLCHDDNRRPDLQVSLPDCTLLGDVTIIHPSSKTSRKVVVNSDVETVGDRSGARKNTKYAGMAAEIDMKFQPIVLYTYGGFHHSAVSFVNKLTQSLDTATCLISRHDFKQALKKHIAVAVQRGTADIMIQAAQRQRERVVGRSLHRHLARSHTSQGSVSGLTDQPHAIPAMVNTGKADHNVTVASTTAAAISTKLPLGCAVIPMDMDGASNTEQANNTDDVVTTRRVATACTDHPAKAGINDATVTADPPVMTVLGVSGDTDNPSAAKSASVATHINHDILGDVIGDLMNDTCFSATIAGTGSARGYDSAPQLGPALLDSG